VDSSFNHPCTDSLAQWEPGNSSQNSSTSDTAAVLNLTVPWRKSSTPRADQNVYLEHCSSCKCVPTVVPRPAHCHESRSPRPAERATPGSSQSYGSSWSAAPSAAPCEDYSWNDSDVKQEAADVVTVDDEDAGAFNSAVSRGAECRVLRVGQVLKVYHVEQHVTVVLVA